MGSNWSIYTILGDTPTAGKIKGLNPSLLGVSDAFGFKEIRAITLRLNRKNRNCDTSTYPPTRGEDKAKNQQILMVKT